METRPPRRPGKAPAEPESRRGERKLRENFDHKGDDTFVAKKEASEPQEGLSGTWTRIKHVLFGEPLKSEEVEHQRVPKTKALAVLASDALSSVAYATEEILLVLVAAGAGAAWVSLPIAVTIAILLGIVAFSYRQTIFHYPQGGGTYTVSMDNLGPNAALVAGSALLVDYIMTVAVSTSAGIAAITSAVPVLAPFATWLALAVVLTLTIINLRGVRESASIFAVPTYFFIASMVGLLGWGGWMAFTGHTPPHPPAPPPAATGAALSLFMVLHAFASGCTAMTGTEAISNGVPIFREPQPKNAATTLTWMAAILATMFLGLTYLVNHFHVFPHPGQTLVSELARTVFGGGWPYYTVQAATALVLLLAANTSYSDFPRLARFMAEDGYLPRPFQQRGSRLSFSFGIVVLGAFAALLIGIFRADTHLLIPLYAVGVFTAFTLSQAGMTKRWWTKREEGWKHGIAINALGAVLTACVTVIMLVTKFMHGAWVVLLVVPLMVWGLLRVHRHFELLERQLRLDPEKASKEPLPPAHVIVTVGKLNRATEYTMRIAKTLCEDPVAVHVSSDEKEAEALKKGWEEAYPKCPLAILESPYRATIQPIIAYLASLREDDPEAPVMVVVPEFVPHNWWEHFLHGQEANRLKWALLFEKNVVVLGVPLHLDE